MTDQPGTYKNYEMPQYQILKQDGDIETRRYVPALVAEVTVDGTRDAAASKGFRALADYIFGNNQAKQDIKMTVPVEQKPLPSEKIAMTVPVVQSVRGQEWVVQFMMPSKYTLDTLPKANNPQIRFLMSDPYDSIAIRFNGFSSQDNLATHQKKLDDYIAGNKIAVTGAANYAFYDSPFTLPWNRRNEIYYRLASAP